MDSESAPAQPEPPVDTRRGTTGGGTFTPTGRHYAGIFLLGFATLLLELSLSRVLSVALWYHFGFLVISTALLGFGVAGTVLSLSPALRERIPPERSLAVIGVLLALATVGCFWLLQRIPFDPFSLLADRRQLLLMPAYYLVAAVPFFLSGLAIALLLSAGAVRVHRLYAWDLLGAAGGCLALTVTMPPLGGSGSVVAAAAVAALAAACLGARGAPRLAAGAAVLAVALAVLAGHAERLLPISVTPNKIRLPLPPLRTVWNTFSRVDLHELPPAPERDFPGARRMILDAGTAATGIVDLRPGVRDFLARNPDDSDYDTGVAYLGKRAPRILLIGSGGGREVVDALHFGASSVTAVEINPIINELVRDDYWGGLFEQPEVRLVTDEGRNFVRRSSETYDAILSGHTISNAAVASGALALAENYVLTREAFADYFDHLASDGVLYLSRPEVQIPRLFATARAALAARGIADPRRHLYAYRSPPGPRDGDRKTSFVAMMLLKRSPFSDQEVRRLDAFLAAVPPRLPGGPGLETLYSPLAPRAESIYARLLSTPDVREVYAAERFQLAPSTDDRPFFNHRTRWSDLDLATVRDLLTQGEQGRMALEDRPVVEVTLLALLLQTTLIAAALILWPLVRGTRSGAPRAVGRWRYLLYFAALGAGFIMAEIALLQRFTLFLGQPTYSLAVVLAGLLAFTGCGAWLGERRLDSAAARRWLLPAVPLVLLLYAWLLPAVLRAALGLTLGWRIGLSFVLLAPLGLLLGMPFPRGIRLLAAHSPPLVPWAWGVNGFFTVIGSVLALMLAMAFGISTVFAVATAAYLAAALTLPALARGQLPQTTSR